VWRCPDPATLAVEYWELQHEGKTVVYNRNNGLVNVSHILNIYCQRSKLSGALRAKRFRNIHKEVIRGGRGRQGTYVKLSDAKKILEHLDLERTAIPNLAEQVRVNEEMLFTKVLRESASGYSISL
jgi:hypothetical protein